MEGQPINFLPSEPHLQPPLPTAKSRRPRVVFLLCIIIAVATVGWWWTHRTKTTDRNDPLAYDPVTLEPKQPKSFLQKLSYVVFNNGRQPLVGEDEDRINILLLGIGGPGHDGPYLSDTIILASIKPSTKQVALVSIPRDLGIHIPDYGIYKINHADAFGENKQANWGGAFATEVIAKTLNTKIPYYVRLDFEAFEEIINEVGGVKVDVERTFSDPEFPAAGSLYQTVSFKKGVQTMNGRTALMYARSRHGNNNEGSDFARARRQQKIILALKEKILSYGTLLNPVRLNNIMTALESHLTTNLQFGEMVSLAKLGRDLNTTDIKNLVFDTSPGGYLKNSSIVGMLEPRTGDFTEINEAIANIFTTTAAPVASATPTQDAPPNSGQAIEIQNGTWNAGLATRIKKRLNNKNIPITQVGNSPIKPITNSGVYVISADADAGAARSLVNELSIPLKQTPPAGVKPATSTDILIILGDDFPE